MTKASGTSEEQRAIAYLQWTGWLKDHDKQIYEQGKRDGIEERKKGRWRARSRKISNTGIYYWRDCSACGWIREDCIKANDTPYCPNCGAKMERSRRK